MNPFLLLRLKNAVSGFRTAHPKFFSFLRPVSEHGLPEEPIVEVKITHPDGREFVTNLKTTAADRELFEQLKECLRTMR